MQQVMGMMQGLQEAMAASKAEQERLQADLAASQARNDELCRMNEELRHGWRNHTGQRDLDEPKHSTPPSKSFILYSFFKQIWIYQIPLLTYFGKCTE